MCLRSLHCKLDRVQLYLAILVVNYCECYTSKFKSAGWFVNAIMPCLKDASYIMHIDNLICGPMAILGFKHESN